MFRSGFIIACLLGCLLFAACQPAIPATPTRNIPPTPARTVTSPPQPTSTPAPFTAHVTLLAINPDQEILVNRVDSTQTIRLFTAGMPDAPVGVPQYLAGSATGNLRPLAQYEWKIATPAGSSARLEAIPANPQKSIPANAVRFTPDLPGEYTVTLSVFDRQGSASLTGILVITATRYAGAAACKNCHLPYYDRWTKTNHARTLAYRLDDPKSGFVFETCAACHTVGYYPITSTANGGFWDTAANVLKNARLPVPQKDAYESLPGELKALAGVQCENCHGPGEAHLSAKTISARTVYAMYTSGTCEQCHNDGHNNTKGEQYRNSAHIRAGELTSASGSAECARCHSAAGFVDFINGVPPDRQRNFTTPVTCAVCHDPHGSPNWANLRVVGQPRNIPILVENAGFSAVCMECHNARTTADKVVSDTPEYPHYSAAAEAIQGGGGYDFGVKIQDSNHRLVGMTPVKDPADPSGQKVLVSGSSRGPCVTCHMYTTPGGDRNEIVDPQTGRVIRVTDTGHNLVGSHSFAVTAKVGGVDYDNTAACTDCHPQLKGKDDFNAFLVKDDADGNGRAEGAQTEIRGLLLHVRQALEEKGVRVLESYPYFSVPRDAATLEVKAAIYNYRFVMGILPSGEGRAAAYHNFKRSAALLQISYAKLAGKDVAGAKILYEK